VAEIPDIPAGKGIPLVDLDTFEFAAPVQAQLLDTIGGYTATANLRSFGADPDGIEPADAAWASMVGEVPNGARIILDGDFLFLDTMRNSGKELHVEAFGSTITRGDVTVTLDEELAIFTGSYGTINPVTSISVAAATSGAPLTTTLNLTSPAVDLAVGDYVRVVADDYVPASRTDTARAAFLAAVVDVSGSTVTVFGGPYSGDPFTTNIRVARVDPVTGSWRGGTLQRAAEYITPAVGGSMIAFRDMVIPRIADVFIPLSSGSGYQLSGCFGADLENLQTNLLRDSWSDTGTSGPLFAYHVLETNSVGTRVRNSRFFGGRHGVTTAQGEPAAGGTPLDTTMRAFGVTEHMLVEGVHVEGTYVSGLDTHEASRGAIFSDVVVVGAGFAGVGLRGRDHKLTDFELVDCNRGIYMFDDDQGGESYGHQISDGIIDNPRINAIVGDYHRFAAHPLYNVRQAVGRTAFTLNNVEVRGAKYSPVQVTNGRADVRDLRVLWADTPIASQQVIEAVNSEVRGVAVLSDNRLVSSNPPALAGIPNAADASIVELAGARILGVTAQVDRVLRSGGATSTFLLRDVLLDEQATGSTAAADFAGASVVDFQTLSGQTDSARVGLTGSTADLEILGRSLRPVLTVQAALTSARSLPNLPTGRVQGQTLVVANRNTSTAALTITQGSGPKTYLKGATSRVLQPNDSLTLQWDVTLGRWVEVASTIAPLRATATWDPASVAAASSTTTTVALTGAALGDIVRCSFSLSLAGLVLSAYVSAVNTVTVVLSNPTGSAVDLGSGTVAVEILK
jgi:hypothetical protein